MMTPSLSRHRAVTLVELLVVLAIISLLATLAVPVYVQKAEQARRATARAEVRNIAEAQQQVQLTHGLYVPIHVLDNLPDDDDFTNERDDFDNDPQASQKFVIDPFVDLFVQFGDQPSLQDGLNVNSGEAKVQNMIRFWAGPFLNPVRTASDDDLDDQQQISSDIVLDPWGRPYLFYSPIGVVAAFNNIDDFTGFNPLNPSSRIDFDNGALNDNAGTNPFDRYAIVSYGSDGLFDFTNNAGGVVLDDIIYEFGFTLNESIFEIF